MRAVPLIVMALLLLSCSRREPAGVALDPALESLIPADTVVLAGAEIEKMRATPLYDRLLVQRQLPAVDQFAQRTGLDPRRDVQELVVASNGKDILMMARGRLRNRKALEDALQERGARRTSFHKYTLFGDGRSAVCFVSDSIAVAGRMEAVQAALAPEAHNDAKRRDVLERASQLEADKHIWVVATGGFAPLPLPEQGNLANLNRVFRSLESATLTLDLSKGASLRAIGRCATDEQARQLRDLLRGLIGFGRLSTPAEQPQMLRFFDGIRVENAGRQVQLHADIPMDLIDDFLRLVEGKRPAD